MKSVFALLLLPFICAQEEPGAPPANLSGGCFLVFDGETVYYQFCDLDIQGFGYELFWTINEENVDIAFRTMWDGWVAFGFTAGDQKMLGSNVVIGWVLDSEKNEFPCVDDYKLNEKLPSGINPEHNQMLDMDKTRVAYDEGYTTIMYTRPLSVMDLLPITNASFAQAILAKGPPVQQPPTGDCADVTIKAHDHEDLTTHFVANVNFGRGVAVGKVPGAYDTLIYIHEIFMAIAWGVLVPMSFVVARFYKPYKPMWFYIHRFLNTMVLLLTTVGIILAIFVFGSHIYTGHMAIGIIVFILALQQPLNAFFRPPARGGITRKRARWEFWHKNSGRACAALGIANVAIGMFSGFGLITTVYVYILWLSFAAVALFYIYCEVTGGAVDPHKPIQKGQAATDQGNDDYRAAFDVSMADFDQGRYNMALTEQGNKMRAETA